MGNNIALAKVYLKGLEHGWKNNSKTVFLENHNLVRVIEGAPASEVLLPVLKTTGLKDYSRASGYNAGALSLTWASRQLTQDRGTKFNLDVMDNKESTEEMAGDVLSTFENDRVIPEVDAYRIAKIAQGAVASHRANGTLSSKDDLLNAIKACNIALRNAGVPAENRVMFISASAYELLKSAVATNRFYMVTDKNINREVEVFDGMTIIPMSELNFCIGWQKVETEDGGFESEGSQINFLVVHKDSVLAVIKHAKIRVFEPDENLNADAYHFDYRVYHDLLIAPEKEKGIYVHTIESFTPETVDTPEITVEDNNTASVKFTAKSNTEGASLFYTTDGTTPTSASSAYSSKVTLTDSTIPATQTVEKTIKVIGIKAGMLDSKVVSKKVKIVGSGT